jgi:endonuclease I
LPNEQPYFKDYTNDTKSKFRSEQFQIQNHILKIIPTIPKVNSEVNNFKFSSISHIAAQAENNCGESRGKLPNVNNTTTRKPEIRRDTLVQKRTQRQRKNHGQLITLRLSHLL